MEHFNRKDFMNYLEKSFSGFENSFLRETVSNLVDYGMRNHNHSLDQFCYWLSDMLPEVNFGEIAAFMDDSFLTSAGQAEKRNVLSKGAHKPLMQQIVAAEKASSYSPDVPCKDVGVLEY